MSSPTSSGHVDQGGVSQKQQQQADQYVNDQKEQPAPETASQSHDEHRQQVDPDSMSQKQLQQADQYSKDQRQQ